MDVLLQQLSRAAHVYRRDTEGHPKYLSAKIDRVGLFSYRTNAMESDIMKSVLLALLDEDAPPSPAGVIDSTFDAHRELVNAPNARAGDQPRHTVRSLLNQSGIVTAIRTRSR